MSSYTYVILICSHIDTFGEYGIGMLTPALKERGLPPFEDSSTEVTVYTMCGNYLPFTDLIEAIEAVPWERSEQVQLFHKHESADRYEEAKLKLKSVEHERFIEWLPEEGGSFDEFSQTHGRWRTKIETMMKEPA